MKLILCVGASKLTWNSELESESTWFQWWFEIDLFFVSGVKLNYVVSLGEINLASVWGIELDWISVSGMERTWFVFGGPKMLGFSVCIEINLVIGLGHRYWLLF